MTSSTRIGHSSRPGLAQVADERLIALDAAADEQRADAGQQHQPDALEVGSPCSTSAGFITKKNGMK